MHTLAWNLSRLLCHPCTTTLAWLFASNLSQLLPICRPSANLAVAQLLSQHLTLTSSWPGSHRPLLGTSSITTHCTNHYPFTSLKQCQGTAWRRVLREVLQDAGQPEALGAWSRVTAHKGCQVRSPDWGPKTGNANKEDGEEGRGQCQVQCSR
jgi:hypothetical protein